jgi:glycosyltransferase involved in cell wall biosynthesis
VSAPADTQPAGFPAAISIAARFGERAPNLLPLNVNSFSFGLFLSRHFYMCDCPAAPDSKSTPAGVKLSVLMPVFNERSTLQEILRRVQCVPIPLEIIVVDNCSTDGTRELLHEMLTRGEAGEEESTFLLRVALQEVNRGKGSSVRRALKLARGEWVIVQDADLEYDPQDYVKLLALAEAKNCDVVFGTRLLPGSEARQQQPRTAFYYGRVGLSILLRVLYAAPISDVATCYKLLRRQVAKDLDLKSSGFDLDFEIGAKVAKRMRAREIRYAETPISYQPRTEIEGKKIRVVHDGLRAARALLKYRFSN